MTNEQKERIAALRKDGYGYAAIAEVLGVSKNTIKTYCNRNGLAGTRQQQHRLILPDDNSFCKECGIPIVQSEKTKKRKFCCKECRVKWWSNHPNALNRKAIRHFTCQSCGKEFTNYSHTNRKYCCHECYIKHILHIQVIARDILIRKFLRIHK